MTQATLAPANSAPAVARRGGLNSSIKVEPLTCAIGAELINVNLGDASRDDDLFAEIKSLLLRHKVLFLNDQDITRGEHVALAERFGVLEDHPIAGSDPEHPGLVRIYKDLDSKPEHYENAFHCDATWRTAPPMGSVLRCVETPPVGGDTIWVNMAEAYRRLPAPRPELWLFGIEPELAAPLGARYHVAPSDAEINELFNTATVFVQTSRHEGFCLPVLEAMATGLPVVCTDAHGNRDFCRDGENCLMPAADPDAVAAAIARVLRDPDLRARLSAAGRETAAANDWARRLDELERFFEGVAASRTPVAG